MKKTVIPKALALCLSSMLFSFTIHAQHSINAAGGDGIAGTASVSYSVGQPFYIPDQGVQHAYEIYDEDVAVHELNDAISLTAFPNPTTDYLMLEVKDEVSENWTYQIYDMQGQLLTNEKMELSQTQIEMKNFSKATYFIQVVNSKNEKIKTFKIIKN